MPKFRRKGEQVIEAEQFHCNAGKLAIPFQGRSVVRADTSLGNPYYVTTIQGAHVPLKDGDWVILEPRNYNPDAAYPCDPEVFGDRYEPLRDRPKIVCLCGSTRFYEAFQKANYEETMAGRVVLSVGHYPHIKDGGIVEHGQNYGCTPEEKIKLDALHMHKIDLADEVLILNVGGYIGESTRNELEHAKRTGKLIRFLEP